MSADGPHIAIIGGGPAGLMAAERLAGAGLRVTIYEHKRSVGRKFLLAGRGGLNITHGESLEDLLGRYGDRRAFLETAVSAFSPDDLRAWCADLGEPTFIGTSDRVFPASFRATPLLRAWLARLTDRGVKIETGHRWVGWSDTGANRFETSDGAAIEAVADATVFALGGASWPRVGSDGGWVSPFRNAGIHVSELAAANCGIVVGWSDVLARKFAGEPIKNARFTVGDMTSRGDAMITALGLEGGPIYALGPALRSELAATGQATLLVDLHPDLDHASLVARLAKRRPKASISSWLHSAGVSPVAVALARDVTSNHLPGDPAVLAGLLKALPIPITAMAPIERAISTAGGIAVTEVDEDFMLTRRPGVFVAGEMLDWEAPTGGYLLQACLSTGVAAASGVLTWLGVAPTN